MVWATAIRCSQCQQPIAPGERFVSFKIPGKESYQFFHRRLPARDCWEDHLKKDKRGFASPARVCRSLPAIPPALSIRIPITSKNQKLRASHFSGGDDDSTELARQF